MRRNRNNRKIIVAAILVAAVVGLSLGFAVFSNTLAIKSSATVNTDSSTFNVKFSINNTGVTGGSVTGSTTGGASADNATISDTQITGLKAKFTKPGQTVTYTFYARNNGQFTAYLNSITYANATGGSSPIKCTAGSNTTASYVASACNGINVTVTAGEGSTIATATNKSNSDIDAHALAKSTGEKVVVKIEYASGSAVADGDFTVAIGDITLNYGSQDL